MSLKVNVRSVLLAAFGCVSLRASVIANASISLDSFTIMPSAGALTLVNPWMAMAFAQGQNSLGENPQDSKGPGLTANAAVMATYVTASGSADATNAEMLAAGGSSKVDIPGMVLAAANGTGRGTLFTTFEITGGTGPVSVAYFANITSTLDLSTGAFGQLAQGEDIFNLQRDGNSIPGLFNDFFHSIGPGDSPFNNTMPLTLSGTETDSSVKSVGEFRLG